MTHKRDFVVGVDLGQARDFTAIGILERFELARGPARENKSGTSKRYELPHIERPALGTPYPDIIDLVKERIAALQGLDNFGRVTLIVDATGCGRPVVDLMRKSGLVPVPVTITGGAASTWAEGGFNVPKRELVSTLAILLQADRLKISKDIPEAAALANELANFRMKISLSGHETFEAWREQDHDDMVLAVAIAAWHSENHLPSVIERPRQIVRGGGGGSGHWMAG